MTAGGVDVFDYMDYRAYLRDHYLDRKPRGMSYRGFARRAGVRSPNYLKLVIEGQRNLSAEMAARFAEACGLEGEAAEYLVALVAFNQARNATERNRAYAKLTGFRRYREAHRLELSHAAYHSTWYVPAVRELVARRDFHEDPRWIARVLRPRITPAEAKRALDTLVELGLVARQDDGRLVQSDTLVSTGPETQSMHISNYHRAMIAQASSAIERIPQADRDISSLTLSVGPDGLRRLKDRVQRFRRELLELSATEDDLCQVVQINFQLFPLSDAGEEPT